MPKIQLVQECKMGMVINSHRRKSPILDTIML